MKQKSNENITKIDLNESKSLEEENDDSISIQATDPELQNNISLLKEELVYLFEIRTMLDYKIGLETISRKMIAITKEMQTEKRDYYEIDFEDFEVEIYKHVKKFSEHLYHVFIHRINLESNSEEIHQNLIVICEQELAIDYEKFIRSVNILAHWANESKSKYVQKDLEKINFVSNKEDDSIYEGHDPKYVNNFIQRGTVTNSLRRKWDNIETGNKAHDEEKADPAIDSENDAY